MGGDEKFGMGVAKNNMRLSKKIWGNRSQIVSIATFLIKNGYLAMLVKYVPLNLMVLGSIPLHRNFYFIL